MVGSCWIMLRVLLLTRMNKKIHLSPRNTHATHEFLLQICKRGALATTIGITKLHINDYTNIIQNYIHSSKSWHFQSIL